MSKTKSDVLSSAYDLKDTVDFPEHDWHPEVRALTDSEFARAQAKLLEGQQISVSPNELEDGEIGGNVVMNLGGLVEGEFGSRVYIVATGMIEKWSESEVRRIPYPGAIQKISQKILDLGGHDLQKGLQKGVSQSVERFRPERRGPSDDSTAPGGSASHDQPAGDDLHSESVSEDRSAQSAEAAGG